MSERHPCVQSMIDIIEEAMDPLAIQAAKDVYLEWCEENIEILKNFTDHYVAIDLNKGIVLAEDFEQELELKLSSMDQEYVKKLYIVYIPRYPK